MELFICIKMNVALITYNGWCAMKPNQTKLNQGSLLDRKNSHCTNTLGKGMNPVILSPAMGK